MVDVDSHFIRLDGAYNVRELGGYTTVDGHMTRKGVFIRSDGTGNLSKSDIDILKNMGLKLVIDLRSKNEIHEHPSKFERCKDIDYRNVVMFDGIYSAMFKGVLPTSMSRMYISLLDNCKDKYAQIFKMFIKNKDGLTLFNCTAGKDRTGVLSMLLLELAGVEDATIVADYVVSEKNMKAATDSQKLMLSLKGIKIPNYIFQTNSRSIQNTLNHLRTYYINARGYLTRCGLSKSEIDTLINRFIQ